MFITDLMKPDWVEYHRKGVEEQAEVQELLMAVLSDLSTAGRQVNNSLDAIGFQNVTAAQDAINEALSILRDSSPVLVEIVTRTAPEES